MQFEWDEEKARKNFEKHGVYFQTARRVFWDENRIEIFDEAHSTEEERYNVIGMVNKILFVVYTERGERIRIISAREATAEEKDVYYDR